MKLWTRFQRWRRKRTYRPIEVRGEVAEMIRDFMASNGYDVVSYNPVTIGPLGGESSRIMVSQTTPTGELQYLTILVYARGVYAVPVSANVS